MKKLLAVMMALIMACCVLAGCGNNAPKESENNGPFKVAVAPIASGATWEAQKTYLENEVAPALNMEFMISETISDVNGLLDFMEKAYAAGCVGIINYVTSNDAVTQGAHKAEEYGMWFITQNSSLNKEVASLEHNLGHCGVSATGIGDAYEQALGTLLDDGENHSLFIFSGNAVGGAKGQGAASHYYTVYGMLLAMQNKYGLTYAESIDDIINNPNPGLVDTGNPDIKIYIYPGFDIPAVITMATTQFQNDSFDIFAAVFSYETFANALADVEESTGKNIKIIATASIEAPTATGFTNKDKFGNSILDAAVLNPYGETGSVCALAIYNALTGHVDAMKDNGSAVLYNVAPWVCTDAATYELISQLDSSHETYVLNGDDLKALCVDKNADVTFKTIQDKLDTLNDVNTIIEEKLK